VALREEVRAIRAGLRDKNVVVARTGIGKANAEKRTATLIESESPRVIIATGFAGGLKPGLSPGDVFVASEVCEADNASARWATPPHLLELADSVPLDGREIHVGRLVTVDKVASSCQDKRELCRRAGADAVDMESSGILRVAAERQVPVICVRAILDEVDFELPFDFGKIFTPEGRPRLLGALGAIAERPGGVAKLLPLRTRARAAAKSLGILVPRWVEALT
jgi:adenosylhomocysteine nucleosidase